MSLTVIANEDPEAASRWPDWESEESELRLNPRLPPALSEAARRGLGELLRSEEGARANEGGVLWVATSGTTSEGRLELIALSKAAFLASGEAVNAHLGSDARDRWLSPLPLFHVGGLAIGARASLSGAEVVRPSRPAGSAGSQGWRPEAFVAALREAEATLSALVPTQVFDLVRAGLRPPPSLRLALVGGDALLPSLFAEARALGWPLLPTYGMTEACSQVATARPEELDPDPSVPPPPLVLLSHMEARLEARRGEGGRLSLRSPALARASAIIEEGHPPRLRSLLEEGWLRAKDRVELVRREGHREGSGEGLTELIPLGRGGSVVKVGGEGVDLVRLRALLLGLLLEARIDAGQGADYALLARPDARLGHRIVLVTSDTDGARADLLRARFNARVLPFERIRELIPHPEIPRTALGKLRYVHLEVALEAALEAALEEHQEGRPSADESHDP